MRQTTSQHCESLRARPSHFWNAELNNNRFRPVLNVECFLKLLQQVQVGGDNSTGSTSSGKKRSIPPSAPSSSRIPKRKKLTPSTSSTSSAGSVVSDSTSDDGAFDGQPCLDVYPRLSHIPISTTWGTPIPGAFPVFHHVSEIQYTLATPELRDHVPIDIAKTFGWIKQEQQLIDTLDELFGTPSEPRTIDLGKVLLVDHHDRLVAISHGLTEVANKTDNHIYPDIADQWLLLVPTFDQGIDLGAFDLGHNCKDLLGACYTMSSAGRATIDAYLQLIVLPPSYYDSGEDCLPFRLRIDITVCLALPSLSMPITSRIKRRMVQLEDAQRRLLDFLFPSTSSIPASFKGETNIPFFYSILGPAPQLPSKLAEEAMQPPELLPTLLPFQRRSVGWLLEREGKTITPSGEIVVRPPMPASTLPFLWDEITLGHETGYFNRLSGIVSPSLPLNHTAMGGILAEEPGLGKTLMCISLILLNPDPGRNPSTKCWDPVAGLEVKEIKTTLIVTPPSLASQWADELALHAPSLKVLIYEGWAKVQVPITEAEAEAERQRRWKEQSKATSRTSSASKRKSKSKVKRKLSRSRNKGKSKYMSDEDSDSDSDYAMDVDDDPPTYNGLGDDVLDWCSYINTFDVCITTYNVLRQDLNVARAAPVRPRREDVVYSSVERARSPLVMCEWYRVMMDEVQMVGGGKIEDMVSLLPRLSSFAVSGTPARSQISDLIHVLKFLRVNDFIGSPRMWDRMLKPGFVSYFASFFQQYAIRTMKSTVTKELTIPQQTRFLVGIDLGRVERHVYDQSLAAALLDLGLDARGVASSEGWEVDSSLLRSWLRRLRGICTHPQVGQLQKPGESLHKHGALKTMSQVLEAMRDQNWRNLLDDKRQKVQSLIRYAQLQQNNKADRVCYHHALETLLLAEKEAKQIIEDVKAAIADHDKKGQVLKKGAVTLQDARDQSSGPEPDEHCPDKGKGRALDTSTSFDVDDADEDTDLPRTPADEEHALKKRTLQLRLREYNVILHRVKFLQGDVYHTLGASHSPAEDAAYQTAETIRHELLKSYEVSAIRAMSQLAHEFEIKSLTKKSLLIRVPYGSQGGIRSSGLMDETNEIIEGLLNEQSELLWSWRTTIYNLLTRKLSTNSDEADGQEYARTLDTQGEAETYLQAYAALLADRREVLVAERTLLAAHDAREKKLRRTKAAIRAAAGALQSNLKFPVDIELQPEHEVLHKKLSDERKELIKQFQGRAIKSIIYDLNGVAAHIHNDKDPEKIIAKQCVAELRQLIHAQGTLMEKLEADLNQFRKAFNERILYFRQLQELSDSVAEVAWESSLNDAIKACEVEQNDLEATINTSRARQRYLNHLARNVEEGTLDEDDETCILCRCEFTRGFITQCAHVFCEECMKAWLLRKEGKACPVCRVVIDVNQMQRFTVHGQDINNRPPPKPVNGEPAPRSSRQILYNAIDPNLFNDIENMASLGSYGNKIQTLIRHLLYIQAAEPAAKSIVFSAWADSLHIIEHALTTNGKHVSRRQSLSFNFLLDIRCLRIDQDRKGQNAAKKFRTDPNIPVLLLHGERENAGLNLTCASRVFLVESVVHHGFELQAIARIDRMSQQQETEVYCYYAEDTVERNILDLAARQGHSLYTKDNSAGTLHVSSFALDSGRKGASTSAKKKVQKVQKGDFIFRTEDMLAILFPHMFEDIEYLLPAEILEGHLSSQETGSSNNQPQTGISRVRAVNGNAMAGPSRLR